MTDDTRALIDQTDDFRRRGMPGAVASNERVLAGRVPALLDRIESLRSALDRIEALTAEVQFRVKAEKAATERADELADQATSQADRIEALEREVRGLYDDKAHDADAIKAGRDRIEALMAERQWQPIETAPKDVAILAYSPRTYMEYVVVEWSKGCWMDAHDSEHFPAHWMPLPQPPTEDK